MTELASNKWDIAIIGGGIIGSSIAYFLARTGKSGRVAVIERDPTYSKASTPLANGGIRRLFSLPENIIMAQFGLDFFSTFASTMAINEEEQPISFCRQGYLFLSDNGYHSVMEKNYEIQFANGVDADLIDSLELKKRYPSINTADIAIAVHSANDGWVDPQAALSAFKRKAVSLGVTYLNERITNWDSSKGVARRAGTESGKIIEADTFVISSGAWSGEVGQMIGLYLPVKPMARENYFFKTDALIEPLPLLKSETNLAFRPEGTGYTGGMPDWTVPYGWRSDLSPNYFERVVWPALAHRIPTFESLRLNGSFVGHYDTNSFDKNAIIGGWTGTGPAVCTNVFIASGFSGHGIMHAPATGLALSELILEGSYKSMDLSAFGYDRISLDRPYKETGII